MDFRQFLPLAKVWLLSFLVFLAIFLVMMCTNRLNILVFNKQKNCRTKFMHSEEWRNRPLFWPCVSDHPSPAVYPVLIARPFGVYGPVLIFRPLQCVRSRPDRPSPVVCTVLS